MGAMFTACTTMPGSSFDALCDDALVISCDRHADAALVVVDADARSEDMSAFAHALAEATADFHGPVRLEARSSDMVVLDAEVTPPFAWQIDVSAVEPDDLETSLESTLAAAEVPGAVGVGVDDGWGHVTVERMEQFEDVFESLSRGVFRHGATYTLQALTERLRIVHVPTRTSAEAISEIISIAEEYPEAEVLLEAMTSGAQWPVLYISHLTPPQQQEIADRLRDPRLADADVDGFPLEFVLGSIGETGVTYVNGTFGGVPVD